jgi:large subunit ribosomal protein L4
MRAKALYTILSQKYRDGEVLFVDKMSIKEPKTKLAVEALQSLSGINGFENLITKRNNATVVVFSEKKKELERAFKNLSNVETMEARNLNPLSLLQYKYLLIENPEASLKALPKLSSKAKSKKLEAVN